MLQLHFQHCKCNITLLHYGVSLVIEGLYAGVMTDMSVSNRPAEVAVTTSAVDESQYPPIFDTRGRSIVKALLAMPNPAKPGTNMLPLSYNRCAWLSLTEFQRTKSVEVWNSLTQTERDKILNRFAPTGYSVGQSSAAAAAINMSTTKNDRARLLHLYQDATLTTTWSKLFQVKNREELDDKENRDAGWGELADVFNDYDGYPYKNVTVDTASSHMK